MADARCSAVDCGRPVTVDVSPSNDGGGTRFDGVAVRLWAPTFACSVVALGSVSAPSCGESPPIPFAGCAGSGLRITLKRRAIRPMKLLCFSFLPDAMSALRSADGDGGGPAVDLRRSIFCRCVFSAARGESSCGADACLSWKLSWLWDPNRPLNGLRRLLRRRGRPAPIGSDACKCTAEVD